MLPAALGQPQNWVGAGVAVRAFNCGGNTLAPAIVALPMFVALKPFLLAAYKAPGLDGVAHLHRLIHATIPARPFP